MTEPRRRPFLLGVFLISFAVLVFQVVQTRILSVIAWYYLAFFAISMAMLGMTAGAVWVYRQRARLGGDRLSVHLSDASLLAAVAMPASVVGQFALITTLLPSLTSVLAWTLLVTAMTVPYVFAGVAVSLALTRSPFKVSEVYGVDLLGAALGCAAVIFILDVLDGPSAVLLAAFMAGLAAVAFAAGATPDERTAFASRRFWQRPFLTLAALAVAIPLNAMGPYGLRPLMVKDVLEFGWDTRTERWNSYSRIVAYPPGNAHPYLWGPSDKLDPNVVTPQAGLNIDGAAGTVMHHFDGTRTSIDFLRYDIVNLAYNLPGIHKSAVIGVGGGRDLLSAHLFGVGDITGVELNKIFVDLHTKDPFYAPYSNLMAVPGLKLHLDDARSWFAATHESFDLIQMSMIDTWAATGAGAFSLSENGLYTLEGWRAFVGRLNDNGVFTVSRWYSPGDVNESGRMIVLALAAMMDRGVANPRAHVYVAAGSRIATLVLSKAPLSPERLQTLRAETERLGFKVLVAPDMNPESWVLKTLVEAKDLATLNRIGNAVDLDLTVPTDNRPFFFNQLRFRDIPNVLMRMWRGELGSGVIHGNLMASMSLMLILLIALAGVIVTIVLPLRSTARGAPRALIRAGTLYFSLIGMGFMFAEISILQFFGVFLGHPIYAMGVCLFSLILSSGIGSLISGRLRLDSPARLATWAVIIGGYLLIAQWGLTHLFEATTAQPLPVRIAIALAVVMPAGALMGFAFPTGMAMVDRIDPEPTPWFWGINGATGVLASVLAVMLSMGLGINVTMFAAGVCYLLLVFPARALLRLSPTNSAKTR